MPSSKKRSKSRSPKRSKRSPGRSKSGETTGYCVRCKAKRTMENPKKATAKNGRKMMKGTCPKCGTKMNRFIAG